MKSDRRGSWYLLTGAVLGIALGLFYSWMVSPVEYVDAPPYALRADFKDEYRVLVAASYLYSNDLLRAKDRLAQLKEDGNAQSLAIQAQQALKEGHPEGEIRSLSILAMALGEEVTPVATIDASSQVTTPIIPNLETPAPLQGQTTGTPAFSQPGNPSQENTASSPDPTFSLEPASTETATPIAGAVFRLQETELLCNPDQQQPLIQVEVRDTAGQPVRSIEILVTWDGGEDHFFTGLKPELSLGYADFLMTPEVTYSIRVGEGGQFVEDITAAKCLLEDESRFWGSWMLTFGQQ